MLWNVSGSALFKKHLSEVEEGRLAGKFFCLQKAPFSVQIFYGQCENSQLPPVQWTRLKQQFTKKMETFKNIVKNIIINGQRRWEGKRISELLCYCLFHPPRLYICMWRLMDSLSFHLLSFLTKMSFDLFFFGGISIFFREWWHSCLWSSLTKKTFRFKFRRRIMECT